MAGRKPIDKEHKRQMFSCKLPPSLMSSVRIQASVEGESVTRIVQAALESYLQEHPISAAIRKFMEKQAREKQKMRKKLEKAWQEA